MLAQEANAIGTTYLRTTFLPDEAGKDVRRLLRDYLGRRIELLRAGSDAEQEAIAMQRVDDLQIALWKRVRTAVVQDPHNELTARLVEALNETIDLEGLQRAARGRACPCERLAPRDRRDPPHRGSPRLRIRYRSPASDHR